jgi:lipopolysaccharide export LptBFGC system permease protein LptF
MGFYKIHKDPASDLGHIVPYFLAILFSLLSAYLIGDWVCSLLMSIGGMLGVSAYVSPVTNRIKSVVSLVGGFLGALVGYYSQFGSAVIGGVLSGDPYCMMFMMGYFTFFAVITYNYFTSGKLIR